MGLIANIYAAVKADMAGFEKELVTGATKAGDKGGAAASKSMAASMKKGAVLVAGALSGALSVALVGRFGALEKAQAEFRRETGATAAEATKAGKAINAMAGSNLQSVEEIGETLTKVTTDLGLTGDEAERTTDQFLKFGRATGQDAASAVLAFDDVLDAWGLTAASAGGIMDQLVASHQKYGGSIEDAQEALARLAPALKANNVSQDEAIGLLNLFAASGLDAAKSQAAFNSAITKLPPGTDLMDFLESLQGIEDPAKRAQEAIRVFGSRAGAGLANALGPGKGAISDYIITAEEVPGATTAAADASLTMVDRIRQGFSGFISGTVEMLGPAGPLLTAVGSLGTLFAPALAAAWKAVIGSAPLKVAIAAAGAAAGAIYAGAEAMGGAIASGLTALWGRIMGTTGMKVAIAAAGAAAGMVYAGGEAAGGMLGAIASQLKKLLPGMLARLGPLALLAIPVVTAGEPGSAKDWGDRIQAETDRILEDIRLKNAQGGADAAGTWMDSFHETWESKSRQMSLSDDWVQETTAQAEKGMSQFTAEILNGRLNAAVQWEKMKQQQVATMKASMRETADQVVAGMGSMRDAIKNGKEAFLERIRDLAWEAKHPWSDEKYVNWLRRQHRQALRRSEEALRDGRGGMAAREKDLADDFAAEMRRIKLMSMGMSETVIANMSAAIVSVGLLADAIFTGGGIFGGGSSTRAVGGPASGMTWVGESGPELVSLPRGSHVNTARTSQAMARDAGGSGISEFTIHVESDGGRVQDIVLSVMGKVLGGASDSAHIRYMNPVGA